MDTSVIGGCFDAEFSEWSLALFDEFIIGLKTAVFSGLTLEELNLAPIKVRDKILEIPEKSRITIPTSELAISLAETYIDEGALSEKSYNDALHIALATLSEASVLTSWNFKHIVNLDRIRLFNSINFRMGYKLIEIRTPREILTNNEKD